MSKKAILITEYNRDKLAAQYDEDDDFLEDADGLYLVADFGVEDHFDLLTPDIFNSLYTKGEDLDNDYFEVRNK